MDLLQLQYFQTIAKYENITKAAEELMVSQPALSRSLSRLESELMVNLFEREGRRIVLNQYGEILLKTSKQVFDQLNAVTQEIRHAYDQENLFLSISSPNATVVAPWLNRYHCANKNIKINHQVIADRSMWELLGNRQLDFVITTTQVPSDFNKKILMQDEYALIVKDKHPLSAYDQIAFEDTLHYEYFSLPASVGSMRFIDELISHANNYMPKISFEGESFLLHNMLSDDHGIIVSMLSLIKSPIFASLHIQSIKTILLTNDYAKFNVSIAWHKDKKLEPVHLNFIQFVENYYTRTQQNL